MRRQGGSFGFVLMLVVLAVILLLALNNFKSAAPAAIEIQKHNAAREAGQASATTSASADASTPAPPLRPSLGTMDRQTTDHSAAVQDALSQAN